jgi:hypothetical protein
MVFQSATYGKATSPNPIAKWINPVALQLLRPMPIVINTNV